MIIIVGNGTSKIPLKIDLVSHPACLAGLVKVIYIYMCVCVCVDTYT